MTALPRVLAPSCQQAPGGARRAEPHAEVLRRAAVIAAAVAGAIAVVGLVVGVACAGAARDRLGLTFPGLPRTTASALDVFGANARLLGVALIAAAVAHITRPRAGAGRAERLSGRVPVAICDVALGLGCVLHVLLVGAALGGYGLRAVAYILPHGPVELAGFAVGLALYADARAGRLTPRAAVAPAALATALLAVAAGLEVFTGA